jgi:hypothetical protein
MPQNATASPFPGRFSTNRAEPSLIVVFFCSESGQTHRNGPSGHKLAMPSIPLKRQLSPQFPLPQKEPPFCPTADSPNIKRPPTVDCDMVDFLDWDRRSNSVLKSRFSLGIKPPRRPNFTQNMHPNKWCRRSLACPNWTTPEYHNVDHGVAAGRPRRFCIIATIAFVGGPVGRCCGAPYSWCN